MGMALCMGFRQRPSKIGNVGVFFGGSLFSPRRDLSFPVPLLTTPGEFSIRHRKKKDGWLTPSPAIEPLLSLYGR